MAARNLAQYRRQYDQRLQHPPGTSVGGRSSAIGNPNAMFGVGAQDRALGRAWGALSSWDKEHFGSQRAYRSHLQTLAQYRAAKALQDQAFKQQVELFKMGHAMGSGDAGSSPGSTPPAAPSKPKPEGYPPGGFVGPPRPPRPPVDLAAAVREGRIVDPALSGRFASPTTKAAPPPSPTQQAPAPPKPAIPVSGVQFHRNPPIKEKTDSRVAAILSDLQAEEARIKAANTPRPPAPDSAAATLAARRRQIETAANPQMANASPQPSPAVAPSLGMLKRRAEEARLARRPGYQKAGAAVAEAADAVGSFVKDRAELAKRVANEAAGAAGESIKAGAQSVNAGIPAIAGRTKDALESSLDSASAKINNAAAPIRKFFSGSEEKSPEEIAYERALEEDRRRKRGPVFVPMPSIQ